jgi:hypothetical protein
MYTYIHILGCISIHVHWAVSMYWCLCTRLCVYLFVYLHTHFVNTRIMAPANTHVSALCFVHLDGSHVSVRFYHGCIFIYHYVIACMSWCMPVYVRTYICALTHTQVAHEFLISSGLISICIYIYIIRLPPHTALPLVPYSLAEHTCIHIVQGHSVSPKF